MVVLSEVLKALAFTPYPELYHGVVHFEIRVSMLHTMESARCEIGLVVHPVNSAPVIHFDHSRLWAATNGGIVKPHKNIQLHGDYVFGVQNGSIAGLEGITFHKGDGSHDTEMDITSTLANLNLQLSRLFYHSGGECRQQNISLSVELDDLGNFGASKDEMGPYTAWMMGARLCSLVLASHEAPPMSTYFDVAKGQPQTFRAIRRSDSTYLHSSASYDSADLLCLED
eukprot:g7055.t1